MTIKEYYLMLLEQLNDINKRIQNYEDEAHLGLPTTNIVALLNKIKSLGIEKEVLMLEFKEAAAFITRSNDILSGVLKPQIDNNKLFVYFNRELSLDQFAYAVKGTPCDTCGKIQGKVGVVYTLHPKTNKLCYICDDCYIKAKQDIVINNVKWD